MNKKIHLSDGITTPDKLNVNPKTGLDTQIIITARNGRHDGDFRVDVVKNMNGNIEKTIPRNIMM